MAKLFFDQVMEFLGVPSGDENQPVQADDPLGTSDPQFGYRDYTPAERAQEVLYGSLDTAGSMLRGVAKAGIEAPRDIYALGSAIGKIQDRTQQRLAGEPVKTIGELFTEAYKEAPSFLPDEATAERKLSEFTPMSRTYSQDASVYNLPEEFGRIAAPLPLLDYARPSQIARIGKTPRILEEGLLTDEAVSALGRIPAGMSIEEVSYRGAHQAPRREEGVRSSLDDMSDIYPEDVYDPRVSPRYYGHTGAGDPNDIRSAELVAAYQGKPEAEVTIYRAVPKGQGITDINKGDWVTLNPNYAASHGNAALGGNYEIISKKVKAKDIISDGNSIHEFGYDPVVEADPTRILPTPRILDARDPITQNTDWRNPALEPLREPTRMGRYRTQYPDTNIPIDPKFAEQQLAKTDDELLADLRSRTNHTDLARDLADKWFKMAPLYKADGKKTLVSDRMQWAYNEAEQELLRRHKTDLENRLIAPSLERMSFTAQSPSKQDKTPAILRDTPKVEKEPPMLRVPAQQARIFNEDGGTGTYSRVEQALLDLKNDPKVTASMTPRQLTKMLEDRGVTKADLQEHGLNLTDYTRKNQHGHDVVDVQKVFDGIEPPQERMGRVILDETGGGDADEMDLQGRQNQGQLQIADFWEHEGQHRMDDWLYDYMGDIENDYNTLGRELSPNTFDRQGSQTDEILEAIAEQLKRTSQAQTDEEAVIMAYDKLNEAIDQGGDWLSDLDAELGGGIQNKAEETIIRREEEFYNENPYIDDSIEFAGEDFDIFGNDDVGYTAHHNGTRIIDDVYSLDELEVRIQNWAMDRGYFGHGTGDGAMQWSSYLAGDDKYFEPLEEVILTYDTGTGRVYSPSHEHYGTDIADGYVVHMRTSARETEDGKSVYHVDEIQSDLHQDARNEGYISEDELNTTNDALDKARARVDEYETKESQVANELYDSYVEGSYTPDFKRLKEIEPKAKAFFAEVSEAFKDLPEANRFILKKQLRDLLTINADPQLDFADLPSSMFRDHPEEFISSLFADRTSLASKKAEKVKEIARKHFNDPEDKKAIEFFDGYSKAQKEVTKLRRDLRKADASYPLKDNRWIKAMVRQAMERAVAKGNFDGITISNPNNPVKAGGAERFMELYKNVYGDRMEKIIKDIGKEYGVTPKKVKLNDPEMQKMGEQWYLPLTKDMIESIRGRGVPLASAVGATPAILDRINKEREDKTPRILRTA